MTLIEAGPPDRAKEIRIPAAFSKLFKSKFDWGYETTPQTGLDGRRIYFPRGKVLGGSSAMNAMMWIPGDRADFDSWPEGWRWEDLQPYLRRVEEEACSITPLADPNPMSQAFLESVEEAQVVRRGDLRPESLEGAGFVRVTQRRGLRCSAADVSWRVGQRAGENSQDKSQCKNGFKYLHKHRLRRSIKRSGQPIRRPDAGASQRAHHTLFRSLSLVILL